MIYGVKRFFYGQPKAFERFFLMQRMKRSLKDNMIISKSLLLAATIDFAMLIC